MTRNTTNDGDQNYEQDNERDEDQNDESEDVEFSVTVRPLSENDSIGATWSLFAGFWGVNEESPPIPPVVWDPDNPASRVDQVPEEQVSDAATTLPSSDQKEEEAENDDTDKETGVERYEDPIPTTCCETLTSDSTEKANNSMRWTLIPYELGNNTSIV